MQVSIAEEIKKEMQNIAFYAQEIRCTGVQVTAGFPRNIAAATQTVSSTNRNISMNTT